MVRRVVRRATPATDMGVNGLPMMSMKSDDAPPDATEHLRPEAPLLAGHVRVRSRRQGTGRTDAPQVAIFSSNE